MRFKHSLMFALTMAAMGAGQAFAASPVVLKVDGMEVTADEVAKRLQMPEGQTLANIPPMFQERILQSLATHLHLSHLAMKRYENNREVQAIIEKMVKEAPAEYKDYVRQNAAVEQLRKDLIAELKTPEAEAKALDAAKKMQKEQQGKQYEIFVVQFEHGDDAKAFAKGIDTVKALQEKAGEKDAGPKYNMGLASNMGWVTLHQLPDTVIPAFKDIKPGQVTQAVDAGYGWEIFGVLDVRETTAELSEGRKNEALQMLDNQLWMEFVRSEMEKTTMEVLPLTAATGESSKQP